jgi:hypothetical protein
LPLDLSPVPTMSLSSKPKKIKPKGGCQELKVVQTVSRKGYDTIKTEEVKTPRRDAKNGLSTSQPQQPSRSPSKRLKLDPFDAEPIPLNMEGPGTSGKRQTLVFGFLIMFAIFLLLFKGTKRFLETILRL